MNPAYVHVALNHVPVLGAVFGLGLLAAGAVGGRNQTLLRAGWVTLVVVALVTIPVYLTGEGAEEVVEGQVVEGGPSVSHDTIEAHEETALVALVAMEALGVLALAALVLSRRGPAPAWLVPVSLVFALAVAGLMLLTAERGGRINHPEIHGGLVSAGQQGSG